jgi:uncharacterized integral membrane protein
VTEVEHTRDRQFPTRLIVAGVILLLIVIFAIVNSDEVKVDFVVFSIDDIALFWVILGSAVIGAIFGYLFNMRRRANRD